MFQSADDTPENTNISLDVERARLYVASTKLNDKLYLQLEERLQQQALRQFFTSTQMSTHAISTGNTTVNFNPAIGFFPSRMYLLLQESSRLGGKFSLNSLKFSRVFNEKTAPFLLKSVKVTNKGEEVEGLACDTTQRSFRDQYFRLFNLLKQDSGRNACSITFEDFVTNSCFLVYDFSSSLNSSEPPLLPLVKKGFIRVDLEFDKSTTCPMTAIVMMEQQSALTIESSGKCTLSTI